MNLFRNYQLVTESSLYYTGATYICVNVVLIAD